MRLNPTARPDSCRASSGTKEAERKERAERTGFEPVRRLPVYRISNPAAFGHSAISPNQIVLLRSCLRRASAPPGTHLFGGAPCNRCSTKPHATVETAKCRRQLLEGQRLMCRSLSSSPGRWQAKETSPRFPAFPFAGARLRRAGSGCRWRLFRRAGVARGASSRSERDAWTRRCRRSRRARLRLLSNWGTQPGQPMFGQARDHFGREVADGCPSAGRADEADDGVGQDRPRNSRHWRSTIRCSNVGPLSRS